MTNDQKDAICQLWIEIFGTQEGAGYNCPQGAYDFAEVVMAYKRDEILACFRQFIDSILLASDPSGLKPRGDK